MFRKTLIVLLIVVFSIDCVVLPQAGAYNLLPPLESTDKTGQGLLNTLKVNPWTGILTFQEEDILVKDLIFPVRLTRTYRSDLTDTESGFGPGWSWSFGMRLLITGKVIVLMDEAGNEYIFQADTHGLYACSDLPGQQIQKKNRGFVRIMPPGIEQSFDDSGRLVSINDPRNNRISIDREREKVVRVSNNLGKGIKLVWSGNYISEVQDLTGRRVRYQYDSHQRLSNVTRPDGTRVGYSYDSASRLMQILYPDNRSAEIDYHGNSSRVSGLTSGLMFVSYISDGNRNIIRYAEDEKWTFETLNNGNLRKMTGPWGGKWEFRFDNGRLVSLVNPYGGITKYSYGNNGLLLSQTDPLGRTTRYVYHKNGLFLQRSIILQVTWSVLSMMIMPC